MSGLPFDFAQAKAAINTAKNAQRVATEQARKTLAVAYDDRAAKERAYRVALAQEITRLKADGVAWTVCGDLARGDTGKVADLRYARDVADGVRESAKAALRDISLTHAADRRELEQLVSWSMSVAPLGQSAEPDHYERAIRGGRR